LAPLPRADKFPIYKQGQQMHDIATLADIASEIETLSGDLHKVTATIELLGKPAQLKANEIESALENAKDRLATALADQASVEREKRLAAFTDISVEVKPGENLLSTGFIIRYTKHAWDMATKETVPTKHICNGFASLADDAYEYLVTEKPQSIPAVIMALAPGKPQEAFAIYLHAKARGYLKGTFWQDA
jgi:hypothetical protein